MQLTARNAAFHARLRWAGAPLLLSGVALLLWAVGNASHGGSGLTVMIGMLGCGMGLASFGANHDTALALALEVHDQQDSAGLLSEALSAEVTEELQSDRAGTMALRPSPRIAMALPAVALLVQLFVFWRLSAGLG